MIPANYVVDHSVFPLKRGMRISCYMENKFVPDALVEEWEGSVYICQNEHHGNRCADLHGYRYSWSVGDGSYRNCEKNDVVCIKIKNVDWDD